MTVGKILNRDEEKWLVDLISKIEEHTTGEIRLHIAKKTSRHGVLSDATRLFKKLGMDKAHHHNGVLLYVSVKNRELACIGDKGIHSKIGESGWKKVVDDLRMNFKKNDYYFGLVKALEEIGEQLRAHFPISH